MYKEANMSYQYQYPAQFSKNKRCYLLGIISDFLGLFIVLTIFIGNVNFSYVVPFQPTYVELLPFENGKELAND